MNDYIPPQVIKALAKYPDGCLLRTRLEDVKDATGDYIGDIRRWYIITSTETVCVFEEKP